MAEANDGVHMLESIVYPRIDLKACWGGMRASIRSGNQCETNLPYGVGTPSFRTSHPNHALSNENNALHDPASTPLQRPSKFTGASIIEICYSQV